MSTLRDLRHALRSLGRAPLFAATAIASLTLGITTATVVFSLVDAAILRPLPFAEAQRLALLSITQQSPTDGESKQRWSWPRFRMLARDARSFESLGSSSNAVLTLTGGGDPEPLPLEMVSSSYLATLRAPMILGSTFDARDDEPGAPIGRVVIAFDLWQRRFGGAMDVVGRRVELNGVTVTIAGVAGRDFRGVSGLAQAWIPAGLTPAVYYPGYLTTNQNFITVIGRLRPGVSLDAARAELRVLGARIQTALPSESDTPADRFSATAMSLGDARTDTVTRRGLLLLGGAASVLLLIACANVASLLLGRAASRRREIAIRVAIGAARGRVVRQLLAESAAIAASACAGALLVSTWAMHILRVPPTLARGRNFYGAVGEFATPTMDWRIGMFAVIACLATIVLVGLVPALRATRADLVHDLKAGGRGVSDGGARLGLREIVVALQVAMCVVLVVGGGLLVASYARLRDAPLGFEPSRLLTFMLRPSEVRYPAEAAPALYARVLDEIGRVPGVVAVTIDGCAPLATQCADAPLFLVDRPWERATDAPDVLRHYVGPSHFATLGIPIVRGRGLTAADRAGAPKVVVINETAARRFWPNENPIGKRVWFDGATAFASADSSAEIVGIVGDAAYQPLDERPVQPDFFTSYAQFTYASRMVLVRTTSDPLALASNIAQAVRRVDPTLALFDVQTMEARARTSWAKQSAQTTLFALIAAIALGLAITGIYAVTAHFVMSRTREIGVRIALGAPSGEIVRASIARTGRLAMIGGTVGLAVALAASRLLRASLYATSTLDVSAYAAALTLLALAVVAASWIPVRRALRVSPVEVLREE